MNIKNTNTMAKISYLDQTLIGSHTSQRDQSCLFYSFEQVSLHHFFISTQEAGQQQETVNQKRLLNSFQYHLWAHAVHQQEPLGFCCPRGRLLSDQRGELPSSPPLGGVFLLLSSTMMMLWLRLSERPFVCMCVCVCVSDP